MTTPVEPRPENPHDEISSTCPSEPTHADERRGEADTETRPEPADPRRPPPQPQPPSPPHQHPDGYEHL